MQLLDFLLKAIEYSVYGYFAISSLYVFVFSVAGNFYKRRRREGSITKNKIALLIPAYKEDAVIVEVSKHALQQHYPSNMYDVVVIADSLHKNTIIKLKELPIKLVEVSFEKSTKAKALNSAMATLKDHYDHAIILDADNIMEPEFLNKMNAAFEGGYQIVQGHRKAKNLNTSFAILDAASEEINNHIFRKGHSVLGLSSGLIGSGMGFEYGLLKSMMKTVNAVGGFDKELEFKFAAEKIKIEYLDDAVVLDEKIQKASDFSNQRKRWLSTQFIYLKKYFIESCRALLFDGNVNFFDKAFQMMIPPRILLIGITFLFALGYVILSILFKINTNVSADLWFINLGITVIAFLLAIPKTFYNLETLKAIFSLPSAFIRMTILLFKLKGANNKFIHTAHGTIEN
ncbi:glycosyltransferase family 2 protein [Litoribaculum gwangyangense]|uniref:Glycosyltransferase family 2 protein n=1 Tax=Litoribaculum gwangyangense TaxID=1130722 RepID=A0ABP9CNG4_9FLAO